MKGSPVSVRFFRFLLVLTVAMICLSASPRLQIVLLTLTTALGLWLFSALCVDAKAIRRTLEESTREAFPLQPSSPAMAHMNRGISGSILEGISARKLGDRTFKADESKTCKTCQSFEPEGPLCRMDGESLTGITVSAVGCQHWAPGLKVAENPAKENHETET